MSKLNLYDLCGVLVSKNGLEDKEARRFVQAMFDIIQEGLDEDKVVKVKGLGTFKIIDVDARESINVNTGGRVLIEGHSKLTFTPDSVMKEIVNKPFSQFETVVLNDGVDFPETQEEEVAVDIDDTPAATTEEPIQVAQTEPVQQVETEPVQQVETEPVREVQTEPVQVVQPEPVEVVQPESPIEEDIPVNNEELDAVEEEPSSETEVPPAAETPEVDTSPEDVETEEEDSKSTYRWIIYCAAVLVLVVAAAYGGYLYGKYEMSEDIAHKQMLADLKAAEETAHKAKTVSGKDSTVQEVDATKIGAISTEKIKQETKKEEKTTEKEVQTNATDDSKKYEDKDARVRTGAYKIVGLDKTVKAKAGQTVEDIAKRNLGPGMSCYVEVYNDLKGNTVLKDGQAINIPKLQLKKRR